MQVGKKNLDFTTGPQKLGDFDGRHEIGCVWATGSCCPPKDFERADRQDCSNDVRTEDLIDVGCDEVVFLILGESE